MFCGNHDAAENAAIMYSLFGCCKARDVNPREWLTDVLTQIPEYNNNYDLDLADLRPRALTSLGAVLSKRGDLESGERILRQASRSRAAPESIRMPR